jgi:predicted nucleic acid-binding protein
MAERARRPISTTLAFWDSSALVPLCVGQSLTPAAVSLYKNYEAVIWWATPVDIASALARLLRMRQLDPRQWQAAQELAGTLAEACSVIQPSDALRAKAMELVKLYDLRAADSLQLAAAMEWCGHRPEGHVFLTADQTLQEAALLVGFDAKSL